MLLLSPLPVPILSLSVLLLTVWISECSVFAFQTNNDIGFTHQRGRTTSLPSQHHHLNKHGSCDDPSYDQDNVDDDTSTLRPSKSSSLFNRRQAIRKAITKTTVTAGATATATAFFTGILDLPPPPPAYAANDVRAPIECLLPATRAKLYIDDLVNKGKQVTSLDDEQFENQLFQPPIFMKTVEEINASQLYKQIQTQSSWNKARRSEREQRGAEMGIDYTTPYDKVNTAIQEWGDKRQFGILRKRQLKLDENNPMRAALNSYTNNLVFSDSYQLNAQAEEKKNMVRNNALPNVNAVVVSDLDLRDLIRNQILQNVDDARAEWTYQRTEQQKAKEKGQQEQEVIDIQEILNYLLEAQKSCNEWFGFIPAQDIKLAMEIVSGEEKEGGKQRDL